MSDWLSSRFSITIYMLAICVGSFFTTARGFKEYLPDAPDQIVWSLSGTFQILIYVTSSKIANSSVDMIGKAGASVIFFLCLNISSLGSFLYFDKVFTADERRRNAVQMYCDEVKLHFRKTLEVISQRVVTYTAVNQRLESAISLEKESGYISREGQGAGPMFETLSLLKSALAVNFEPEQNFSKNLEEKCQLNINKISELSEENRCQAALECFNTFAVSVSSPTHLKQLQSEINQVFGFFKRSEYNKELTIPTIPPFPDNRPIFTLPKKFSLFERISGAVTDLKQREATTLLALFLAVIIDLTVLILGLLRGESSWDRGSPTSTIGTQTERRTAHHDGLPLEEMIAEFEKPQTKIER